ncbi:hypothetical protein B0I35DRAFT_456975 [Stachybotrys elegans]|uniref:Uncharacterized protein n=1 Tax=Stachybotrys elegans TaxID=80388 RepID=A0A8K0T9J1_9HYPO|nr:hypothetical protein B0I35DRAFT_456975 [Stachybotrys elegans]
MEALNCTGLNATECLLRVTASILEELKESNWDPASFVVTFVIGIIAAAFAFFAIIQGLLAAGPGRHKCSIYAIGTWARLSKRKFDWSELRYRSIAQTPVIRVTDLVHKMTIDFKWGDSNWNQERLFPKLKHDPKDTSDYFPATWLRLLTYTRLHHPELWPTNPQGTDYLPSDLAAAPAYSTIADLTIIASIAAGKIRFDLSGQSTTNEASIQGEYMDLNFRNHPILGVYGAIDQARVGGNYITRSPDSRYDNFTNYYRPPARELFGKIAYSQGYLPVVQQLNNSYERLVASISLSPETWKYWYYEMIQAIYDPHYECGLVSTTQEDAVGSHRDMIFEWCQQGRFGVFNTYRLKSDCWDLEEGGILILAAAVPVSNINLFPRKLTKIDEKLIFLVILSRYCMKADVSLSEDIVGGDTSEVNTTPGAESRKPFSAFQVKKEIWLQSCVYTTSLGKPDKFRVDQKIFSFGGWTGKSPVQRELDRIDSWIEKNQLEGVMVCRVMALALTAAVCKQMYHGNQLRRRWPTECDITREERKGLDETINNQGEFVPNSLSAVTDVVSLQVRKLRDYQQNLKTGAVSVDEYYTKSCKTHEHSRFPSAEKPFRFLEYMEHITKLWEKDGDGFKYPTEQVQYYLDDLLIYRATLIHMIISQAADNNHIVSNPDYLRAPVAQ